MILKLNWTQRYKIRILIAKLKIVGSTQPRGCFSTFMKRNMSNSLVLITSCKTPKDSRSMTITRTKMLIIIQKGIFMPQTRNSRKAMAWARLLTFTFLSNVSIKLKLKVKIRKDANSIFTFTGSIKELTNSMIFKSGDGDFYKLPRKMI